jgi:hypothetical protein
VSLLFLIQIIAVFDIVPDIFIIGLYFIELLFPKLYLLIDLLANVAALDHIKLQAFSDKSHVV